MCISSYTLENTPYQVIHCSKGRHCMHMRQRNLKPNVSIYLHVLYIKCAS